jgi:phage terminase small subunit
MTSRDGQQWDRRHPDFEPGNTMAVRHGSRSVRLTAPLAEEIKQGILDDPELPDYLRQALFAHALDAYCFAEAQCIKLRDYLASLDLQEALTDVAVTDEDEHHSEGTVTRHSVSRRRESAQELARRYEAHAANLRSKLGLDPASAAKLGRNLAAAYDSAKHVMAVRAVWDGQDGQEAK